MSLLDINHVMKCLKTIKAINNNLWNSLNIILNSTQISRQPKSGLWKLSTTLISSKSSKPEIKKQLKNNNCVFKR